MPVATSLHPSSLTWLGMSPEATYGTPAFTATTGPVFTLPLDASTFNPEDKPVWLRDIAIRGSMAETYAIVQGVEDAAWSLGGPVYPGLTPLLIEQMMGDVTTTQSGGSAGTATNLTAPYTRHSTGLSLTVASITGISNGSIIQVANASAGFAEFVKVSAAPSGSTVPISTPLHFNYPTGVGSTVTVYTGVNTFSHKYAALNLYDGQPPTYTLLDSTNVVDAAASTNTYGQRYYTSTCLAQLDFTVSAEQLFTCKGSGTSWSSQPTTVAPVSATSAFSPTTVTTVPIPSWSSTIQLSLPVGGGLTTVNYVGEVTFSLKRKLQIVWTNDGVQTPYIIARGPLGVTGTVKNMVAQDEQILQSMLKNFQGALTAQVTVPSTTPYPATEQGNSFLLHVNQAAFTAAKPVRSQVLVGYESTFEAVANTTDVGASGGLGPMTITAVDTVAGY